MAPRKKKASRVSEPVATHPERATFGAETPAADERPTRKNHYLYQSKIDLAKELLGVTTETEAIDGALDMLIYGEALARGTAEMAGEEYHDVLGIGEEIPES